MRVYEKSNYQIASGIGERFKGYRIALRMTQKELSEQSGVSVMTIVRFERGEYCSIKLDNFIALLRVIQRLEYIEDLIPDIPESLYSEGRSRTSKRVRIRKDER